MVNLFLINSYLTYLVARLVVEREKSPREKNIFVFLRGIKPLDPSKYVPCYLECAVVENNMPEFPTYLKFYKGRKLKADLFKQIRSFTRGERFKLHTFQTISRVVQLIRSMPECMATAVMEEGACDPPMTIDEMSALYANFGYNTSQKIFNFLNYGNSIRGNIGFIEKGLEYFCLFDEAFPGAENTINLHDSRKILGIVRPREDVKPGSVFFIHTWFFEPSFPKLFELYAAFVFQMARNYFDRPLYHRFHPAQQEFSRNLIKNQFLKNNCDFNVIPDSEPIEAYIFSPTPYTFIGSSSSVLCYARRMGKEVDAAL